MFKFRPALLLVLIVLPIGYFRIARSTCTSGGSGDDTIVCDTNPSTDLRGNGGNDTITITENVNYPLDFSGDAIFSSGTGNDTITNYGTIGDMFGDSRNSLGTGQDTLINNGTVKGTMVGDSQLGPGSGDDVLVNNGTVNGAMFGDSWVSTGSGDDLLINYGTSGGMAGDSWNQNGSGSDTIINQGSTGSITGDTRYGTGSGNDTIVNSGIVTGSITGDNENGVGTGSDTILNSGTVGGSLYGDSVYSTGTGSDLITNTGTVVGSIYAQGGNDTVFVSLTATVGGVIDGGDGTDQLGFTGEVSVEGYENFARQIAALSPSGGTLVINGRTFTWLNFEQLVNALRVAMTTPSIRELCSTMMVKVFDLPDGSLDIYGGFSAALPTGFQIAAITADERLLLDTPYGENAYGWTATLNADGTLTIRDGAGAVMDSTCRYRP